MKAITICQPYASLICLPESDFRHKRVENRTWYSHHRGPLVIHAGKSRDWFEEVDDLGRDMYGFEIASLPFGAIVAVADQVACFPIREIRANVPEVRNYPWLNGHEHAEGPYCHVLANVRVLPSPIPWKGAQGYFCVPDELIAAELRGVPAR